jgi:hypothetical protein
MKVEPAITFASSVPLVRVPYHSPIRNIQDQPRRAVVIVEVEHAVESSGLNISRVATNAAKAPVVLDEAKNGSLVGGAVIDIILFRVR